MSESSNYRVIFSAGKQRKFFENILDNISVGEAAKTVGVSKRTIRDWRREKYRPTFDALKNLCKKSNLPFPNKVELKKPYAHTKMAGRKGGLAIVKKYGKVPTDEKKRAEGWRKWWEKEGKNQKRDFFATKEIKTPKKSPALAEFVGIMIGDGGIRPRQVVVTLHSEDDAEYADYVSSLLKNLFNVPVSKNFHKNHRAVNLTVSRTKLVDYCVSIGLVKGNKIKKGLDIPPWIKKNGSFRRLCLRGLVDTDGCIFEEVHKVNGKVYRYPRLHFVSASEKLRKSVHKILKGFKFEARMRNNRAVTLEKIEDVVKYFRLIGSSNPKHKQRYNKFIGGDPAG